MRLVHSITVAMSGSKFGYFLLLLLCVYESKTTFDHGNFKEELNSNFRSIMKVLSFMETYTEQLNLDAYFGVTLAKAQLEQALNKVTSSKYDKVLEVIIYRCERLLRNYADTSDLDSFGGVYDKLFKEVLLNSHLWYNDVEFSLDFLDDLGLYSNWTTRDLITNTNANFDGLSSDKCLGELLERNYAGFSGSRCYIGADCKEMMFANRKDTLYLLTHRLLYLQLSRGIKCSMNENTVGAYLQTYCSLILKEARTNEYLGFPNTDLFLEQVLLCGIEGFEEFLTERWRRNVVDWQTIHGCYKNYVDFGRYFEKSKRTANIIVFGCVDHTTGLGLAALSLNVRYLMANM